MTYLADTNACIVLLRQMDRQLVARWQATQASEIVLCSIVVYELRHGAQRSSDPIREHSKLDLILTPLASLPFDDSCVMRCAEIRHALEGKGTVIGPHDLQIASIALQNGLILVTHNLREFSRVPGLICEDWQS